MTKVEKQLFEALDLVSESLDETLHAIEEANELFKAPMVEEGRTPMEGRIETARLRLKRVGDVLFDIRRQELQESSLAYHGITYTE